MLKVTIIDRSLFINMTVLPKSFKHSLLLIDRELFYPLITFSDERRGGWRGNCFPLCWSQGYAQQGTNKFLNLKRVIKRSIAQFLC